MRELKYYWFRVWNWLRITYYQVKYAINWKVLIWTMLINWAFMFVVWTLFFEFLLHIVVPTLITTVVNMLLFLVVFIKLSEREAKKQRRRNF